MTPQTSEAFQSRSHHVDEDPFHLQSSDNPGMILVTVPLTEINYLQWNVAMTMALGAKRKLAFATGSVPKPQENEVEYERWLCVDRMVRSWILNTISKELVAGFWYSSSASELWSDLKEQFGENNGPMVYKIQRDINSIRQGNMSVTLYYTNLKRYWDEYNCLVPKPNCVCGGCSCGAIREISGFLMRNQLIQFLVGLNDTYDNIRNQILLMEPVPTVSKAYSMVLRIEKAEQSSLEMNNMLNQSAHIVRSNSSANYYNRDNRRKGDKFYTHCKKDNHNRQNCFQLKGYPEWWKGRKKADIIKITN